MKSSLFLFIRVALAWFGVFMLGIAIWSGIFDNAPPWPFVIIGGLMAAMVLTSVTSHLRRVRLIMGHVDSASLANRQRRMIEVPMDADAAFQLIESAVRELPRTRDVESARDSLQVRAKVERFDPYGTAMPGWEKVTETLGVSRNQLYATVTPRGETSTITLICEPEGRAWCDWFLVDDGANLENAEAIVRAVSRRIGESRKSEKATVQQTVTEKELAVARLGLLHAQVEPHFLYNTLGSAKYLIQSDPKRAEEMLDNLIQYLRHSLPKTGDGDSTLGEELERVRAYLDILQIRMGARLATHIDVPAQLRTLPFPAMMLQTLVENAIKHGLEPKPGGGNVWVLARQSGESVSVTVADDGMGLGSSGTEGTGIGLANVRERLRLAHGDRAAFTLVSNFPSGVAATITLPAPAKADHE